MTIRVRTLYLEVITDGGVSPLHFLALPVIIHFQSCRTLLNLTYFALIFQDQTWNKAIKRQLRMCRMVLNKKLLILFSLHSEACNPSPHLLHVAKVLFWTPNYSFLYQLKPTLSASQLLCLQNTSVLRNRLIPFTDSEWSHRQINVKSFGCLLWATQESIVQFNMACCNI